MLVASSDRAAARAPSRWRLRRRGAAAAYGHVPRSPGGPAALALARQADVIAATAELATVTAPARAQVFQRERLDAAIADGQSRGGGGGAAHPLAEPLSGCASAQPARSRNMRILHHHRRHGRGHGRGEGD